MDKQEMLLKLLRSEEALKDFVWEFFEDGFSKEMSRSSILRKLRNKIKKGEDVSRYVSWAETFIGDRIMDDEAGTIYTINGDFYPNTIYTYKKLLFQGVIGDGGDSTEIYGSYRDAKEALKDLLWGVKTYTLGQISRIEQRIEAGTLSWDDL